MKGFTLLMLSLLSILYCLRFGYIWTAYGHGGQITGIPFALIMIVLAISYFRAKNETRKEKMFYASLFYFLSLACFSITVEAIRNSRSDYFELLYGESKGIVDKIFLVFVSAGFVGAALRFRQINNRRVIE